jgi:hypothetical protein
VRQCFARGRCDVRQKVAELHQQKGDTAGNLAKGAASTLKSKGNGATLATRKAPARASVTVEQQGSISAAGTAVLPSFNPRRPPQAPPTLPAGIPC